MDDFERHVFYDEQGLPCEPDCIWCKETDAYRNRGMQEPSASFKDQLQTFVGPDCKVFDTPQPVGKE